ncbi:MAG: hypothetical protein AB1603_08155 [Chloroflexota bacterium]
MDRLERRWRKIDEAAGRGEVDIHAIVGRLTREQMLGAITRLLTDVEYEMLPVSQVGGVTPDFHARRQEGGIRYEVVGVLCMTPDEVGPCYQKLEDMEKTLGGTPDYAIAVHQMPEYLLYDMLEADKGKLYINMKDKMFMMWVCYATEEGERVWCFLGGSRDKLLEKYFTSVRQLTAEAIVGPRVADMLMEEEAEEF